MQKYSTWRSEMEPNDGFGDSGPVDVYLASDVNARIEKLEKKLHEVTHCSFCGQPTYPVCTGNCDNDE